MAGSTQPPGGTPQSIQDAIKLYVEDVEAEAKEKKARLVQVRVQLSGSFTIRFGVAILEPTYLFQEGAFFLDDLWDALLESTLIHE